MTRRRVDLEYIADDAARKISYKKRKKSILKKVKELSILCGIEVCAIIYSDIDGNDQPQIFPSQSGVESVISKFKSYSQVDQHKHMFNQETYLKERINKALDRLEKARKENREKEMTLLMNQCLAHQGMIFDNHLSLVDLNDLSWVITAKMNDVDQRLRTLNDLNSASSSEPQPKQEVVENQVVKVEKNEGDDRGKGVLDMNMDGTQEQDVPWYLNLINGGEDESQTLPFDDNFNNGQYK